jgi:hypothetical protein
MAQHDYNIANQSGADFRADLNNALLAIATVNSGSTEPSTTFAHQLWVDTSSSVLKIRNAADNAWITTGVSITASNTFTGNLTGDVTGNLTGNVTGNVTGDLTGNAVSSDTLSTARTISLSGDVVGSVSFDGSANVDIDTVVQINSITLGTDTTGDYVESMSGGTGVTVTGGTGEGSTPSIAIGQAVAATDDVTFNIITATEEFIGDLEGGIRFNAKADGALSKGDVVYISGVSGDVPTVAQAKADDASKMPAFGLALSDANDNAALQVVTFGTIEELNTSNVSEGQILYVSTTAGAYTTTAPTGESSQIQNIGKVIRSHAAAGSIKVGGAGRSNATPNLDNGKIFIGNGSNQSVTSTLDTSIVVENTNLYYTTARANTDFDSRLATKNTDNVSEGTTNLYYTTSRTNTDFDTRLATKSTSDLAEGTNLYYTSARFDSAFTSKDTDDLSEGSTNLYYTQSRFDSGFGNKTTADLTENTNLYYTDTRANSAIDARVTKAFVDALGIQATSVAADSVALGTDTTGNYVSTITGTANKITVSGSGSESADITLSLPDDVQIASDLTVAGNLTVNGTLTSLDTTNLDIEDNLFQLNAGLTGSPVNDSGMLINRGTADNGIFMWDESVDKFTLGLTTADGSATGNITLNSLGTLVANIEGNVTGAVTGTVSSLSNHDTDDLTEGSNLYYTQARFDSALAAKSTSDLSEGTNLYYTDARFDTRLASKDTDDVSEGTTNLYYTSTRFNSAFSGKSTSDLAEGSNLYYTDARVQAVSINNVVEDTTPQLGGDLDLNSSDITGTGDINITGTITSSGNITGTLATAAQPNITSVGTLTGLTTSGDINFGDNDKAVFGAGSDLEIYHNANTSFITESGSSNLKIGGENLYLQNTAHNENYLAAIANGAVTLYYNNSAKLATTSTGIDVTGTATFSSGFTSNASSTITTADNLETLSLISTDTDANVGPVLGLYRNSASPADNDTLARVSFFGNNDADEKITYAQFAATLKDVTDGTEDASLKIGVTSSGSFNNRLDFLATETVFNEDSKDLDFRVESDVNSHALFVQGSDGYVGIGTDNPSQPLTVSKAGDLYIQVNNSSAGFNTYIGTYTNESRIVCDDAKPIAFFVNGSRVVDFANGGNVGIGTDNPSTLLHLSAANDPIITLTDTGFGASADITGSNGNLRLNSQTATIFDMADSEVARFDASGNLLVGQTTASSGTVGTSLRADGRTFFCADGNYAAHFNRNTSDGAIVHFAKDDSIVGSIGASGGDLIVGTGDTGLYFYDGADTVIPWNITSNSARNGSIDLGASSHRFKDLYLSGGAYIGGTGSANHLDDYEEGTYIPTWTTVTGNPASYRNADNTSNTSTNGLSYVKIGRQVTISGAVFFSSGNSINNQRPFMTLPFAAKLYSVNGVISSYKTGTIEDVHYLNYSGSTLINLFKLDSSGSHVAFGGNGAIELYINITYQAA